jgi:hypothetical protein
MPEYLSDPYHHVYQYNEVERKFRHADVLLISTYQIIFDGDINSPCV